MKCAWIYKIKKGRRKMENCPICDFNCPCCDANGYCMLSNLTDCDDYCYYNNIDKEEEEEEK